MKHVGVRDFRDHATRHLATTEPIAVERHGRVIGFYFPVKPDKEEAQRALSRIDATLEDIVTRTGMSQDELVASLSGSA